MLRRRSPKQHPESARIEQYTSQFIQGLGEERQSALAVLKKLGPAVILEIALLLTHELLECTRECS